MWQPIETALKDGTLILAFKKGGPVLIEWESDGINDGFWRDQGHYCHPDVTHWQRLPPAPGMHQYRFEMSATNNIICKGLLCLYAVGMGFAIAAWGI